MAAAVKTPKEVDNCRPVLKGMAKYLCDRLYGPAGPPWGTRLADIEQQASQLAATFRKEFLDLALARQATAFLQAPPPPLCLCPSCGRDTLPEDPEPRLLFCQAGVVEWWEPHRYCPKCRRAFFPQSKSLGIDHGQYSSSLLELVCYCGANKPSFREASQDLAKLAGLAVHEKQVERLCKRLGGERVGERDGLAEQFLALPLSQRKDGAPAGVARPDEGQVAVVMADAGMLQLRAEPADASADAEGQPAAATAESTGPPAEGLLTGGDDTSGQADAEASPAEEDYDQERPPSGRHWHEDKVGLVMVMSSQPCPTDPSPDIPDTFVDAERVATIVRGLKKSAALQAEEQADKTPQQPDGQAEPEEPEAYHGPKLHKRQVVASRRSWPAFGVLLASAAWLAGLAGATRKAFVADGAQAIWAVWQARFSSYVPILDFIHAMSYVYEAAKAVGGATGTGWQLYAEWITWTWQGQVSRVIAKLTEWQQANGKPEEGEAKTSVRAVVARTLGYLQNNQDKMKYDEYRKAGLPIVSSLVESMVKQISRRVKGTEKFWSEEGAEALLQLRADYLSDGDVMAGFWQRRQAAATGQRCYRPRS
jgi:hypothetical protein